MTDKDYFIMLADPPAAGPTATVKKGPEIQVNNGVCLEDVQGTYEIVLSVDRSATDASEYPPLDIHGPTRPLLFSQRFVDVLDSLGVDNIQYFDADVVYEPTGETLPYNVANVVGVVSGLNLEQSDVIVSPKGNVLNIEAMCLDEQKLEGHKVCRLEERVMHIVVHKSVKEAVEAADLTGFLFVSDDEYEPSMI